MNNYEKISWTFNHSDEDSNWEIDYKIVPSDYAHDLPIAWKVEIIGGREVNANGHVLTSSTWAEMSTWVPSDFNEVIEEYIFAVLNQNKYDAEFKQLIAIATEYAEFSISARKMVEDSGLTVKEISDKMGLDSRTIDRLLKDTANKGRVKTVAMLAWACGYKLKCEFVKR